MRPANPEETASMSHPATKAQGPAPKFPLGQTVATPGAMAAFKVTNEHFSQFLDRHARGDWGDVGADDARENDLSVAEGFRILSAYTLSDDTRIWIITEADRSSTCVLLPGEY